MACALPRPARRVFWVLAALVTLYGAVWSLNSDGTMPLGSWLPHRILHWATHNADLRNLPAYLVVSTLWFLATPDTRERTILGALILNLAGLIEIIQLVMPGRTPSLADVAWSWAGIVLAWAAVQLLFTAWQIAARQARA